MTMFSLILQMTRSYVRPHIKYSVSEVIAIMVTLFFLRGLCGYVCVPTSPNWEMGGRGNIVPNQFDCISLSMQLIHKLFG